MKGPGGAGGRTRAELARRERALSGHTEQRSRLGSRRYPSHVRVNQSVTARSVQKPWKTMLTGSGACAGRVNETF